MRKRCIHASRKFCVSPRGKLEKKKKGRKNWRTRDVNGIHFSRTPTAFERALFHGGGDISMIRVTSLDEGFRNLTIGGIIEMNRRKKASQRRC